MKIRLFIIFVLFASAPAFACEVCEQNQPELLQGITHGIGPTGNWDYVIIGIASVIVLIALVLSIKYLVKPKEGNPDHIKNIVTHDF